MAKKGKRQITLGPVITIVLMILLVIIGSFILSKLGFTSTKTEIVNGEVSTTIVGVNNLLSADGIRYIFSSMLDSFKNFNVLYVLIIALLGIGIADDSGLFRRLFKSWRKLKLTFIIILTLIIGCLAGTIGTYSYAIMLPLTGYIYKNLNKNPLTGILTMFFALTIGQAAGLMPSYLDTILGTITESAAIATVDKNYLYNQYSTIYIVIAALVLIAFLGQQIIEKYLIPKLPKLKIEEEIEELELPHNGLSHALVTFAIIFILILYAIIPGLPLSGLLLGEGSTYLECLLGESSPFGQSYVFLFSMTLAIVGMVYGFKSGKFKNLDDFTRGFSKSFAGMSIVFVLMFFLSQLIALFEWTNLNVVISCTFINWLSSLQITGMGLIIIYFTIIVLVSVLIPSSVAKWQIIAPIAVPLLMRANMTASFAQYIFTAADGIGKSISIIFPYSAVLFGLIYKYTDSGNFGFIKLYKMLSPLIILFTIVWIIIIITWYVVGIPTGIGVLPNL